MQYEYGMLTQYSCDVFIAYTIFEIKSERKSTKAAMKRNGLVLVCGEPFSCSRPRYVWVQIQECKNLAHSECTPGLPYFVCPNREPECDLIVECLHAIR